MKRLFAAFVLLASGPAWPQAEPSQKPEDDGEIVAELLGYARAAPPGFTADAMIRIATSSFEIPDAERIDILKTAFRTAAWAREPTIVRAAPGPPGSNIVEAGFVGRAATPGIDAVTLQARALTAMLERSATDAEELVHGIVLPALQPAGCSDGWTVVVDPYYDVLATITSENTGLDPGEIGQLIQRKLGPIHSFAQVAPAASLLTEITLPAEERLPLLRSFAASIEHDLTVDPLTFAVTSYENVSALQTLIDSLPGGRDSTDAATLVSAYRSAVVRQFRNGLCTEVSSVWTEEMQLERLEPTYPLGEAVVEKAKEISGPTQERFVDPIGQELGERMGALWTGRPDPLATAEYSVELEQLLDDIAGWGYEGKEQVEFHYLNKLRHLNSFIRQIHGEEASDERMLALRKRAIREMVMLLEHPDGARLRPFAWFGAMKQLLDIMRDRNIADQDVFPVFLASNHPVLRLYAKLAEYAEDIASGP